MRSERSGHRLARGELDESRGGNDNVVMITGASAGVGRATARAFARRGARIGLIARNDEALSAAAREVAHLGGASLVFPADVSHPEEVEDAAEAVEHELGPIDVWVNNAMVTVMSEIRDMTSEEFRRVTEVTYLGTVHGTLSALKRMLPRDRGKIVQVGSALSYRAIPLQSAYCAAKHAIRGFSDSLRCELIHQRSGVSITMVQLPALNTPQFDWSKIHFRRKPQPVPPIFQPEVAAEAIVFAAASRRREIWVGGRNSLLMALNKIAPGVGDWYLGRTGYESQFTDEPADPDRPHNLYRPLPGDWGARGSFDHRSRPRSLQLWATEHRSFLLLAGTMLAASAASWLRGPR